ncbi:phenylalanine--tRNA ligase subunit beta [Pararhodonellum marinum]|uniref:phenylalanine--tRNA ligase subunit beta n=1 Tax=Pararhodonellum marinum TaxID=2755358 RepID=UPI00188E7F45|nr:phenylalanine--tRNA ligase subunit beta [Pararhodonellum marinum]
MKISINRLKDYIFIDKSPEEVADLLTQAGLEVEGIEMYDSLPGGLEGIVIGEVLSCEAHPNADRLSKTTVDIGTDIVPIICGAPNVAEGQKVAVATVGAKLYPTSGESFEIKKAKIRGEVSEGMICAEDELGLGESHDGIMVLNTKLPNGTPASKYFKVIRDHILEIGLTPNRADAASHLGVARDLKALLQKEICLPEVDGFKPDNTEKPVEVIVANGLDCPRYAGVTITGLKIAPSPEWLQHFLKGIGLEPINNVVDITNYVLHDLGQPLHAFDLDKIKGNWIVVKRLTKDTPFVTLDDKERKLSGEELMICDEVDGLCMAGIFGGKGSGVSSETKGIFLESACFSPDIIRKGSQFHGLKTDASFRFERGTDPNMPVYALKRAALMIKELAGGVISSDIIDIYPEPILDCNIPVLYKHIDRLIGKKIDRKEIKSILKNLEIKVSEETEEGFVAIVKPYRVDVTREADIIEEILRIYGFEQVPLTEHYHADYLAEHPEKDLNKLQYRLTEILSGIGFHEIITNSLTKPAYAEKSGFLDPKNSVKILNQLSEDLGVMRQTLLFSGMEVLAHNINRRQKDLRFFEFGTCYFKTSKGYREEKHVSLFLTGNQGVESWRSSTQEVTFSDLYAVVELLLEKLNIRMPEVEVIHERPFEYALRLMAGEREVGILGLLDRKTAQLNEVKQQVFFAKLDWDYLGKKATGVKKYEEISKFPEVRRDLSLVIDQGISFDQIRGIAYKAGGKLLQKIQVFDVYQGDKIDEGKKAYALSFYLQDQENTLTDKVIDKTMAKLMQEFEKEIDAYIRK